MYNLKILHLIDFIKLLTPPHNIEFLSYSLFLYWDSKRKCVTSMTSEVLSWSGETWTWALSYKSQFCCYSNQAGAGRSSEVERSLMVRWVVGSILHGVDPLSYFSFQPVFHNWFNKGRGMCYPVCGMVHIKEPLLLINKSSLCGSSGFPFSLSEWSLTICLTPYNRR